MSVDIGGETYMINTDFRTIMDIEEVLFSPDLKSPYYHLSMTLITSTQDSYKITR